MDSILSSNSVTLKFPENIRALGSFMQGRQDYDDQVRNKIDFTAPYIIEIPDQIEWVSASYVQGFMEHIVSHLGYSKALDLMTVKCSNKNIKHSFKTKLV